MKMCVKEEQKLLQALQACHQNIQPSSHEQIIFPNMYLPIPLHRQEVTQGQFLSGV